MTDIFKHPISTVRAQDLYGPSEVGITHPHNPSFIKVCDNGDVEIFAGPGVGIILSASSNTITLVGEAVRFLTQEKDGLMWNTLSFNEQATTFSQPALIPVSENEMSHLFNGVDTYINTSPVQPPA